MILEPDICEISDTPPDGFLPQSVAGRVFLFALSLGAIAFASPFLVLLLFVPQGPAAPNWGLWLFRLGMGEFCSALFLIGCVGWIWAVATPRWLPAAAQQLYLKMAVCLLLPWVMLLGYVLWPF